MKYVWIFADYSQAEARVVATAGPIPSMKSWFARGEDIHLHVAKLIGKVIHDNKIDMPFIAGTTSKLWSRKPWTELSKSIKMDSENERHIAKTTVHGNNYDMGRVKFATVTRLPLKHAQTIQNIYHSIFPEIRGNYHAWIKSCLRKSRCVVNAWGWPRQFYDNYDNEMERAGYAWYPQSTIGMLNIHLLTEVCEVFGKDIKVYTPESIRDMGLNVQAQLHDSIGVVVPDDPIAINDAIKIIKEKGSFPLNIRGESLVIPLDVKIGDSMGTLHDI